MLHHGHVSTGTPLVVAGAFLASGVEMVEALTIVLGVGIVRGWRSTLIGAGAAAIVLAVIVAALGPALRHIPLDSLRLVVGALLLAFGLQWLRKGILRAGRFLAVRDEDAAFHREQERAEVAASEMRAGLDWYAFTVSFKGVLLEGLEVVFIVIAFGSAQRHTGLAAAGAGAAFVVVLLAGVLAQRPLSRVPENTIKFAVGVMLTSFGCFWGAEGAGVDWPGDELSLLAVIGFFVGASFLFVWTLRRRQGLVPAGVDA